MENLDSMRLSIFAFGCGIAFLQTLAGLPNVSSMFALAMLAAAGLAARRSRLMVAVATAVLGFVWAGWMAQQRMADQLPTEWENRDIQISGVVASLPQRFERGERFEFDVESVQTGGASVPHRIALSFYHSWDDLDEAGEEVSAKALHPGERWRFTVSLKRPHGNANPHGFDALV